MIPGKRDNHMSLKRSFAFARQGFVYALKTERNIRVMLVTFALAIIAGVFLQLTASEWAFIIIGSGVVFSAELTNTALEAIVDLTSPEYNELAGHAKDIAAAAVHILCIFVAIAGIIVYAAAIRRIFFL